MEFFSNTFGGGLLESFRFWDEDDYECEIFSILNSALSKTSVILAGKRGSRRHSTTSFSESRSGGNKLSNARSFIILLLGEGLTSFSINNATNFVGEKSKMKLSGLFFF